MHKPPPKLSYALSIFLSVMNLVDYYALSINHVNIEKNYIADNINLQM